MPEVCCATVSYVGACLWNWRLLDRESTACGVLRPSAANAATLVNLGGGQDEMQFIIRSLGATSCPRIARHGNRISAVVVGRVRQKQSARCMALFPLRLVGAADIFAQ